MKSWLIFNTAILATIAFGCTKKADHAQPLLLGSERFIQVAIGKITNEHHGISLSDLQYDGMQYGLIPYRQEKPLCADVEPKKLLELPCRENVVVSFRNLRSERIETKNGKKQKVWTIFIAIFDKDSTGKEVVSLQTLWRTEDIN